MGGNSGDAGDNVQLSLLQGFGQPARPQGTSPAAAVDPVAQVLIESPLPHLDREFDYLVPEELSAAAVPGARIKARFGGQELAGYITARKAEAPEGVRLVALSKVVSPQPVLTPGLLRLATAVAERYAGNVSDVVRAAVPPRVAKVDQEFAGRGPGPVEAAAAAPAVDASCFAGYRSGPAFLSHLAAGESPRAVLTSHRSYGPAAWPAQVAAAVAAAVQSGRGALAVVPDARDLARLEAALAAVLGTDGYLRLSAEDGPTPRYRNYLRLLHGDVRVAVGTRSAAYAPVPELGLIVLCDDGDDLYVEQRAPYQHTREVLLLRAGLEDCAMLLASVARSTEAERLVQHGWAQPIQCERPVLRTQTPRVVNTADSFQQERDPLLSHARLPQAAWRAAQDGLARGPVLVQVARTGFSPSLACQDCRTPARCPECSGPLGQTGRGAVPACRWCGRLAGDYRCPECGSARLRASVAGAARTAEELGRAFPGVPVISSAGEHIKDAVGPDPALVVATPGAEPVAEAGYAAALLLDGNAMLSRESLRASEETLRRWFGAASLVRPAAEGGLVVVTADSDAVVGQLVRWDPAGAAARELGLRRELQLPPAVRIAALTGSQAGIELFVQDLQLPPARLVGPVPLPGADGTHRLLVFFGYREAAVVTAALRTRKAALSAKRTPDPVQVRLDGLDFL
ncbi:primosomal protein N' [Arthrobacter sp. I2-34]|uniref:Probable replication restart protein PriA n=1 Tax=Arthrobacter hankyongi TaxID=2904801 RepID=A0ABS9LD87_9MICC|nr:primosomal protein N' [Arthrobacter hankyongi]MCG2624657.1 primosomal protein N' [Arthrobacter hankyongi]